MRRDVGITGSLPQWKAELKFTKIMEVVKAPHCGLYRTLSDVEFGNSCRVLKDFSGRALFLLSIGQHLGAIHCSSFHERLYTMASGCMGECCTQRTKKNITMALSLFC